jgi:ribosomal protein S12 methylthiotransferase
MYLHPAGIPSGLSRIINESDTILPYLDIPFQHVSETVLRAMGRPWKGDRIRKLVDRLRNQIPGLVLRTTLMVGFPGEGEREFRELRDFVESFRIEHVGVFTYSPEEGTLAHRLGDPVRTAMKEERAHEIRLIHARYTEKRNRARIGTIEECLIEGVSAETDLLLQGRAWDQAPEVDGSLFITGGTTGSGATHTVKLTGACGPDLFGEIV